MEIFNEDKFWRRFNFLSVKQQLTVMYWTVFNKKKYKKFISYWNDGKSIDSCYEDVKN